MNLTQQLFIDARRYGPLNPRHKTRQTQRMLPQLLNIASTFELHDTISYSLAHIGNRLIVADERGDMHVLAEPHAASPSQSQPRIADFTVADNASIFDLEVSSPESTFAASSNGLLYQVDVERSSVVRQFKVHKLGIRCVRENPVKKGLLVTASRDEAISCIDVERDGLRPQWSKNRLHTVTLPPQPMKTRMRKRGAGGLPSAAISSCAWLSEHDIVTAGVGDGKLKIWDLRKWPHGNCGPVKEWIVASRENAVGKSELGLGISWVDVRAGYILAAVPREGKIVVYRVNDFLVKSEPEPVQVFSPPVSDSFYIRPKFSPNAEFVAADTEDHAITLWNVVDNSNSLVKEPERRKLQGHNGEVTMISWAQDYGFASTGDDGKIISWKVGTSKENRE